MLAACSNNSYYDKGKEFSIVEDSVTTPFKAVKFEKNESCKECHPIIYDEYTESMHYKATVFRDPIHNAVWEAHPNYKNKSQYKCAQCHIPGADNIEDFMNEGKQAMPDENNFTQNEAVSCAVCHKIASIEKHRQANRNIYSNKKEEYYGIREQLSIAHLTNSNNKMYSNGKMCMGCHSHRENIKKYVVCVTEDTSKINSYETCITCHMPQVKGPSSTNSSQQKHFFHGFPGAHNNINMLAKHVTFSVKKIASNEFELRIINKSSHDLFPHPLRKSVIKISIIRKGKAVYQFDEIEMERIMKDENGIAGCTLATKETLSSIVKRESISVITEHYDLKNGDELEVEYGYYLVKGEMLKTLNLENNDKVKAYRMFKKECFLIK